MLGLALISKPALEAAHDASALTRGGPLFIEDRQARARIFATRGTRHSGIPPTSLTPGTQKKTATGGKVFSRQSEVAELRWAAARRAVARIARPGAGGSHVRPHRLEHRADGCAREEPVRQALPFVSDPGGDELPRIGGLDALYHSFSQLRRARSHAHIDHRWHHHLGHVSDQVAGRRPRCRRLVVCLLLHSQQRAVEVQQLAGEWISIQQISSAAPTFRVRTGGNRRARHHIFSRLTRNALNSGVRALASPTKGVSAFASQYRP